MRERWQNPEYRAKALKHLNESRALQTEETRRKISETMKRVWEQVGVRNAGAVESGPGCWIRMAHLIARQTDYPLDTKHDTGALPPQPHDRGGDAQEDFREAQGT